MDWVVRSEELGMRWSK